MINGRIPAMVEARLPIIQRAAADVGRAAGKQHIAGGLPGFKQEPPLLGRRERKVNALGHCGIVPERGALCKGLLTITNLS